MASVRYLAVRRVSLALPVLLGIAAEAFAQTDSVATLSLSEVVVTGSNKEVSRNLLPYTVTSVSAAQIKSTGQVQLLSAVSGMVPSLFVTQRNVIGFGVSNGGSGHIKLRGVGGDRASSVLMMVDGQPQFAGLYSHHVADFYQTEYVDHVEVLRGPGSVLYGSNAMAGVINVITKQPQAEGINTSLTSRYGSYNTWLSSLTNTVRCGNFTSLISAGYDRTDGLKSNFGFRQSDLYAKIGYRYSQHWQSVADYSIVHSVGDDPVYPTLSNPESTDIYHQSIIRGESSITVINRYASTSGVVRFYYSYGNHYIDDPRHFHSLDDRLGVIAYQNFAPWRGSEATLGFDFDRYTGKIPMSGSKPHQPGSLSTMTRKQITEYSPYATLAQSLLENKFALNAGLRIACSSMFETQAIAQGGFSISPIRDWQIKGSVSKGYRNPSFRELYLYKMANPDLEPEQMINCEITTAHQFGRWLSFDVTAYFCKGSQMIQTVDQKNVNTGSFINKGIEISARSHPLQSLQIWASYSFLHTSLSNLTGAPRHQYYIGASYQLNRRIHFDVQMKGVDRLYVSTDVKDQSYATVDVKASWLTCKYLQLTLDLDNVTDARYTINRGYPMPGFTAMGGFKLSF